MTLSLVFQEPHLQIIFGVKSRPTRLSTCHALPDLLLGPTTEAFLVWERGLLPFWEGMDLGLKDDLYSPRSRTGMERARVVRTSEEEERKTDG